MSENAVPLNRERTRILVSAMAALAIHAALFISFPFSTGVEAGRLASSPGPLDVQLEERRSPAAPVGAPLRASPAQSQGVPIDDFVIPTPKNEEASGLPMPTGTAFREAGGKTGNAEALPLSQSPVPLADIAAGQQGATARGGIDTGAGAAQRGGKGVLVAGQASGGSEPGLDLGQLDKALAGGGSAQPGTGAARADYGETDSRDYRVVWDEPDASGGRKLLSAPKPNVPQWVSAQGLTLSVTVAFTLLPDGVVSGARLERSSGYSDVDSAVIDAIRRWRFTASTSERVLRGLIPYMIRAQ